MTAGNPFRRLAGLVAAGFVLAVAGAAGAAIPEAPAPEDGGRARALAVAGADRPGAIRDRYIVVFRPGTSAADVRSAREQAGGRRATILYDYSSALQGFAATLPTEALDGLRQDPNVESIEADVVVTAADTQTPATFGLDRIDQRSLPLNNTYTYDRTGSGVTVYVIDSGIRTTHAEFGGRAQLGTDTVGDGRNGNDCNGHGTHAAGTIGGTTYGVAKHVRLVSVRVLNCSGSGTVAGVIAGIDWVTANRSLPAVAHLGVQGTVADTALDNAVRSSISAGVVAVTPAGNSNADACNSSPSRVVEAMTVGATKSSDVRSSYSNFGPCVDLFAPGGEGASGITSAWNSSDSATNTINGTSPAAAHVSGAAALYLQNSPTATPVTVRDAIVANATVGVVTNAGSGSPTRLLYTGTSPQPARPADFDGDGDTDIAVFRPPNGYWFINGGPTVQFGTSGDVPVPGDYDGNGTTDIAVFRPSNGIWFVNGGPTVQFGTSGDVPVPGDYDGNGTTDIAVFRPSTGTWFIRGGPTVAWGISGDIPVPGNYHSTGAIDISVFRPSTSTWFVRSGPTVAWGTAGDIPAPGDYNLDGVTDMGVFRPSAGIWFVRNVTTVAWGTSGDIPVPGDYDGDDDIEVALFRPSSGYWFAPTLTVKWGASGDVPLPLPDAIRRFFFPPLS
jgi:subtilisin family serine protease